MDADQQSFSNARYTRATVFGIPTLVMMTMNSSLSCNRGGVVLRKGALGLAVVMLLNLAAGCVPVLVGTATVTAIDLYLERRTVNQTIDDNTLEIRIARDFATDDLLEDSSHLNVTAVNGIVLLTGETPTDAKRQHAEKLARAYVDTREVVNEIELSGKSNLTSRANDSYITGRVKAKLIAADGISSTNINVTTERGKVYLLGLVTRSEADIAVAEAKTVPGVTHIVKVFEYIDE